MILILLRQKIYDFVHKLQCLLFSKHDFKIWKCREIITKQRMPWLSNFLHVVVILIHGCKSCHPHLSCFLRHLNLDLMRSFYIPKKKKKGLFSAFFCRITETCTSRFLSYYRFEWWRFICFICNVYRSWGLAYTSLSNLLLL